MTDTHSIFSLDSTIAEELATEHGAAERAGQGGGSGIP